MTELEALNQALPYLQAPVATSLEQRHPTLSALRASLATELDAVLDHGYWFNTRSITLNPDSGGLIQAPTQIRALYIDGADLVDVRGAFLWNITHSTNVFAGSLTGRVLDDLTFEEVPNAAARLALWRAALNVYVPRFGVDDVAQSIGAKAQEAQGLLEREHLRKSRYSMQSTGAVRKIRQALRGL